MPNDKDIPGRGIVIGVGLGLAAWGLIIGFWLFAKWLIARGI